MGVRLQAQYYLNAWNDIATYIGAGGSYYISENSSAITRQSTFQDTTYNRTREGHQMGVNAFSGVQYNLTKWFAVHAEIVGNYVIGKSEVVEFPKNRSESNGFNLTNSGIGGIFYF